MEDLRLLLSVLLLAALSLVFYAFGPALSCADVYRVPQPQGSSPGRGHYTCTCSVRVPASGAPYIPHMCRVPQALSRLTHLPVITIYLAAGLLSQLFMPGSLHKPLHDLLQPVHDAALGCITLAAGGRSCRKCRLGAVPG